MLKLTEHSHNQFTLYYQEKNLGKILLYDNPCHQSRTYVTLQLRDYPLEVAKELFNHILSKTEKGLQVMLSSSDYQQITFLQIGGFTRKRRCFEVEATLENYRGKQQTPLFSEIHRGSHMFTHCAKLLYTHYQDTHQAINPWTGSWADFYHSLPDKVFYSTDNQQLTALAFIEDNEIAYLAAPKRTSLPHFIAQITTNLFAHYPTISFEADDTDPIAMVLLNFFEQPHDSWDTYVLDREKNQT